MEIITSKSNEKVKYIRNLNEKKFRQKYNEYYLEGIKVVSELLDIYNKKAVDIVSIAYSNMILKEANGGIELLKKIEKFSDIEIINIDSNVFKSIVETVNTQGILAVIKINNKTINEIDVSSNVLILDKLQDSGNVGTIIRTADSFNVKNIICISGTADVYSQKVLRSTMASIFRVNIIYINEKEIKENIEFLKKNDYHLIGTSLQSNTFVNDKLFNKKCAIVVGNESNGISDMMTNLCDMLVKIPISDSTESLNVACATSILLYEQYKK
ncbi:MAG: RNA methyltransferase [Clostridia bacterium]